MRGHVIGPLGIVHEAGIAILYEVREERLDIPEHIRIGVFTDDQTRARMPAEDMAQTHLARSLDDERSDLLRNLVNAATVCRYLELFLEHAQYPLR